MKIYLIDDTLSRKRYADSLGATFLNAQNKDFPEKLNEFFQGPRPGLVILDHFLDNLNVTEWFLRKGSTIAEAIKEQWPECPVICVTGAEKEKTIDHRTKLAYDAVFDATHFLANRDRILAIGKGFALTTKKAPLDAEKLIALLKAPKEDLARLKLALPEKLKTTSPDDSAVSIFFEWVGHLMERSGFLYDKLAAATFVGLTEEGFDKVATTFEQSKYAGVFANSNQDRWWSSALGQLLFAEVASETSEMSWDVGRNMAGIESSDFSKCYKRCGNKRPPETVAYLDQTSDDRRAMHLSCSVLHPGYKREIYFDDVRVMEGE